MTLKWLLIFSYYSSYAYVCEACFFFPSRFEISEVLEIFLSKRLLLRVLRVGVKPRDLW